VAFTTALPIARKAVWSQRAHEQPRPFDLLPLLHDFPAMLPLVRQKLALQDKNQGTALMSGYIVAAQVVMVPMAILVGRRADIWGLKPLFLAGLAILSLRGFLYCRIIVFGWLRSKVLMASALDLMARFFRSSSRI
jgi:MFS family permease